MGTIGGTEKSELQLEFLRRLREESLRFYEPNPTQLKFHSSQALKRGLFAANQSGKSWAGNNEIVLACGHVHPWRPNYTCPVFARDCYESEEVIIKVAIPTYKRIIPRQACKLGGSFEIGGRKFDVPDKTFEGKQRTFCGLLGGTWEEAYDKANHVIWFANGSFVEFKTYRQDLQSYAGPPRHIIKHDEEPPEAIYGENVARQVTVGRGQHPRLSNNLIFSMTPLNYSAWLYNDIYLRAGHDDDIEVFEMSAYDNPTADHSAIKHLEQSITDPAERAARIYGKFTYIEGLVYKEYGDHNFIEPFPIPRDWNRSIVIDPHPEKPSAVNWFAEDPDGRLYVYREGDYRGSVHEVCQQIKAECAGEIIDFVLIDPAAKGQKHQWGKDSIYPEFQKHFPGVMLGNNNTHLGREKVKQMLRNNEGAGPRLFVFRSCPVTDMQMRNYSWKPPLKSGENRSKPEVVKRNDDHPDCIRYRCMATIGRNSSNFKGFNIGMYVNG